MALEPQSVAQFYRDVHGGLRSRGIDVVDLDPSGGSRRRHPLRRGRATRVRTTRGTRDLLWRGPAPGRSRAAGLPGPASSARPARSISSGAASTWRRRASPADAAPRHPGGMPNCPDWVMEEAESGQNVTRRLVATRADCRRPAFYVYAYPEPTGFRDASVASRQTRSSMIARTSSCCRTTRFARPPIRTRSPSSSCNRPTRQAPTSAGGIAPVSSQLSCRCAPRAGRGASPERLLAGVSLAAAARTAADPSRTP